MVVADLDASLLGQATGRLWLLARRPSLYGDIAVRPAESATPMSSSGRSDHMARNAVAALACLALGATVAGEDRAAGVSPVHPRLLLDAARVESLRPALETTHRFLWERYEQDMPGWSAWRHARSRWTTHGTRGTSSPSWPSPGF